jgi:hypothetical protein
MAYSQTIVAPTGQTVRTTRSRPYIVCRVHLGTDSLVIISSSIDRKRAEREVRSLRTDSRRNPALFGRPFIWLSREQKAIQP